MRKGFIVGGGTYWSEIGRCSLASTTGMTTGMTSSIRTSTGSSYYPASSNTSSVVRSTSTGMTTDMTTGLTTDMTTDTANRTWSYPETPNWSTYSTSDARPIYTTCIGDVLAYYRDASNGQPYTRWTDEESQRQNWRCSGSSPIVPTSQTGNTTGMTTETGSSFVETGTTTPVFTTHLTTKDTCGGLDGPDGEFCKCEKIGGHYVARILHTVSGKKFIGGCCTQKDLNELQECLCKSRGGMVNKVEDPFQGPTIECKYFGTLDLYPENYPDGYGKW